MNFEQCNIVQIVYLSMKIDIEGLFVLVIQKHCYPYKQKQTQMAFALLIISIVFTIIANILHMGKQVAADVSVFL